VKDALAAAGEDTREDWEMSQDIPRADPLCDFLAPIVGGDDALDGPFRQAARL